VTEPNDITDILTDQERILRAAWMLPNEGLLSEAQRDQAMENFRQYIHQHGIKVADVARQLGKPRETTILDLMNGVYRSSADRYIRKLNMWVEQHARQRAASLTDKFVTTLKVAKDMLTIARLVRENQTMGLCLGPTGIGKSRCAEAIHEKYVGSIYVRIITGYHHPMGLTRAIAGQLGVRSGYRRRNDPQYQMQLERVIDAFRDSSRLLIIDEAHALQDRALELLRDIHDTTGIPILMIATKELHDRIKKNADPDRGQLYSRCEVVHHLTEGYDVYSGGKALHTLEQIRELYNEPPVKLSPDAARYLQSVANMLGYGSLRRCKMLLRNAVRRARKRQEITDGQAVTVTADDLEFVETRLRQESSERDIVRDRRTRSAGLASS
jgi:DNA transposition AAA+ family ATPase